MFQDKVIINELTRLISQLHISDAFITFRNKQYAVTSENKLSYLTSILYSECYALKESCQSGTDNRQFDFTETDDAFTEMLSQNNHSKNKTEENWIVKSIYPNGYLEIAKETEIRIVAASALLNIPAGATAETGQIVTVLFPKEDKYRQPTFYYVFSNQYFNASQKLTRIYWNCTSEGAAVLVNAVTSKLNHYNIPFLFKCLNHPNFYFRRDAAVLYIEDSMLSIINMILPEICEEMKEYLEEDVPLFAYAYAKGVGIAESPNEYESFGMNRAAIIAETLLQTASKNQDANAILNEITTAFSNRGISPKATYLNKGSKIIFN
ncbi:T3SS effector HopA1 family protein [Flavobacterium sp. HTF]|uniref:T3SS effector HopA1 family protein n=1 Tax=Flavobacterium sp. HTF TaxID=2170732 RepID=UPI000D5FB87A|nr:T3SS effector HopA1 family protein [Flavobacterium sp. HTF]PWB25437.1 hypothetical protein DCO46_08755 [Flavobacterium sp. HTF]